MKRFLLLFAFLSSFAHAADTTFVFTAPTAPNPAPTVTTLSGLVTAVKSISTAFGLTSNPVVGTVDTAATNFSLSIKVAQLNTANVNQPTYSNGVLSWTTNTATFLNTGNAWVQTDVAGYNTAADTFRDFVGGYAVKSIMEGSGGINRFMAAIDGTARTVNNATYTPTTNYNAQVADINNATTLLAKNTALAAAITSLGLMRTQAAAIDARGADAMTLINGTLLPESGRYAASFASLDALLTYHGLTTLNP